MTENDLKKMIYRLSDLTPTEKLTLLVALSFVDWVSWEGTASINQFADALATQRRAISRALKGLACEGLYGEVIEAPWSTDEHSIRYEAQH